MVKYFYRQAITESLLYAKLIVYPGVCRTSAEYSTYRGNEEKLLRIIEQQCGKSLINKLEKHAEKKKPIFWNDINICKRNQTGIFFVVFLENLKKSEVKISKNQKNGVFSLSKNS